MMGSRDRKLISLRWQQVLLVLLSFLGGSLGQTPFRMQSLLKSLRDNCSFLMALALLTYLMTSPLLPALIFLMAVIVDYQPLQQKQVQSSNVQLIRKNKSMDSRRNRQYHEYQDQAFLRNFNPVEESRDILEHLCDEDDSSEDKNRKKVSKEERIYDEGSESIVKIENKRSGHSKEKKKIFYRDKMAELMKPGEYIKQEYNYIPYTQYQHDKAPISKEEQLKRNRESAKNSRQRKKQYVAILQQKNEENSKLIQHLSEKLEQVTLQRDRLKQDNHQQIKNFLKSKAQAYEELQKILSSPHGSNELIKNQVEFMLQRFSASGSERIAVMNYYMNEIIQDLISDIHKYFLTNSAFNHGYSASNQPKPIDLQVMKIMDLDLTKMSRLVLKFKERFHKQATVFKTLTQQFYRVFKSIENQSKVIQLVFIDMIKEFDIRKVADLILWFQQNQFCRQVKRIRKQWIQQLKTGQQPIQIIRKQTKQN